MATRNDITGDALVSKSNTDAFREGWERIFGKKDERPAETTDNESVLKQEEDQNDS